MFNFINDVQYDSTNESLTLQNVTGASVTVMNVKPDRVRAILGSPLMDEVLKSPIAAQPGTYRLQAVRAMPPKVPQPISPGGLLYTSCSRLRAPTHGRAVQV